MVVPSISESCYFGGVTPPRRSNPAILNTICILSVVIACFQLFSILLVSNGRVHDVHMNTFLIAYIE